MNLKFILFIPIIEILLFILFGDFLGFFLVVFLIIMTGALGLILLKSNINLNDIKELALEPNEWVYKKIAGLMLIIPGFFTDFIGFVLLIPFSRKILLSFALRNKTNPEEKNQNKIIDGEIVEKEKDDL